VREILSFDLKKRKDTQSGRGLNLFSYKKKERKKDLLSTFRRKKKSGRRTGFSRFIFGFRGGERKSH